MSDPLDFLPWGRRGDAIGGGALFTNDASSAYRQGDYATATPRRLAELLYDAAVGLCEQAIEALDAGEFERAADRLGRARSVFQQIQDAVEAVAAADGGRFGRFCREIRQRLLDADHYRRREEVAETLSILTYRRPNWPVLIPAAHREPGRGPTGATGSHWVG